MKYILILATIILTSCSKQTKPDTINAMFYNSNGHVGIYMYSTEKINFQDSIHVTFELLSNGVHRGNFDHMIYFYMNGYEARYKTDIELQYVPEASISHPIFGKFAGVAVNSSNYDFKN